MPLRPHRSLEGNSLGGYYDDEDEFQADSSGIEKLSEALKVNKTLTSIKYVVARPFPYRQGPLTLAFDPCLQLEQQFPPRGRSGARGRGAEDKFLVADPQVRRFPSFPAVSLPSRPADDIPPQKTRNDLTSQRTFRTPLCAQFLFAMPLVSVRRMDAGHMLMSDGWVVRGLSGVASRPFAVPMDGCVSRPPAVV